MIVTEKLQKITHTLLSILAAATLALSMASAAFAQEITERYTSLYDVTALRIEGSIVTCSDGFFIDISSAKLERPIEVGDTLLAIGEPGDDPNFPSLVKASQVTMIKARDVEFDGKIKSVDSASITVQNQRIKITPDTEILGTPEAGASAYVSTESRPEGFVAFRILVLADDPDAESAIIARITALKGHRLELVGGFFVILSDQNLAFLQRNNIGVGARAYVNLRNAPKKNHLKSEFVGSIITPFQLRAPLQQVDLENNTITVLNKQITVNPGTRIENQDFQALTLNELMTNAPGGVIVDLERTNTGIAATSIFALRLPRRQ